MSLEKLLAYVTPEHRAEVERTYLAFTQGATTLGERHIDSFAKVLSERGLLSTAELQDFLTFREPTLSPQDESEPPIDGPRYEPMTLLARGGMGEVYLGTEPTLRRTVAIKRMKGGPRDDATLYRRFVTEAQVTAQLDHPAIVPVYGFEQEVGGTLAYAMKFVRGVTLSAFIDETEKQIERDGRPDAAHSLKARVETLLPVLNALAYAHRRGVIHRDLKPENIMVGRFGEVLVMDWGIARLVAPRTAAAGQAAPATPRPLSQVGDTLPGPETHDDQEAVGLTDSGGLTRVGAVMGTPDFMSPEQARGEELDAASDQYSLGLILQELVTLKSAIPGRSSQGIIERARVGDKAPIVETHEPIPRELRSIIAKATAFRKEDRYASVEAMADDVRRFLHDESVMADPDSGVRRVTRWIGNHRGAAMAMGIGLLLLSLAVAAFILWRGQVAFEAERQEAREREQAIMDLGAVVDAHCARITERLHDYEKLLTEIATSARVFLTEPAPPSDVVVYHYSHGRRDPEAAPADAVDSKIYGPTKSVRHADFTAAPDVDRQALRPEIDRLARLEPVLRSALLASAGEAAVSLPLADAERLVLHKGVPLAWTYFAAANGVSIGMPGTWDYDASPGMDGYDHRKEQWYLDALKSRGLVWSSGVDENGLGLLFTCAGTVRDPQGKVLGVAALDLVMARLIDDYLDIPELARIGAEALLIDREGRVQVRSSQKEVARTLVEYAPPLYEEALVREGILRAEVGHVTTPDGRLALWKSLGNVGLSYVVIGAEGPLLAFASARP